MKSLVIGLALLCAAPAFALDKAKSGVKAKAANCNPYIVTVNSESGEGSWVYPCANHTVTYRGCNNGEVSYDTIVSPYSGEYEQVAVTCKNGTFHGTPAAVKHATCKKGEIAYDNVRNPYSGELENATVVCKNGRFVRR
jgi:hypothetical protein